MKVILRQEVKNLGREWDLVTVSDGYARNFLIPRNLAMPATHAGMQDLERRRQKASVRRQHEEDAAKAVAEKISAIPVTIVARSGPEGRLYGSVTAADIAEYLAAHGADVDRRKIEIGEPIRSLGEHYVNIPLYSTVNVRLRVQVDPEGGVAAAPEPAALPDMDAEPGEAEEV